jgi:2Fe-2S iron-sulfur cluster binding domain
MVATVAIDGAVQEAHPDELLIELLERMGRTFPHVCYHPQLGPVQTCETCIVEGNGRLVRACATRVTDGMTVSTNSAEAAAPQVEAFDRILKAIPEGLAHATAEPEKPIWPFRIAAPASHQRQPSWPRLSHRFSASLWTAPPFDGASEVALVKKISLPRVALLGCITDDESSGRGGTGSLGIETVISPTAIPSLRPA